ncbi:hypothetical protein RhiirA1_393268 [Rhizophagus irregularis]|uniref:Uncharacterized protein n=1 Tax=Rhizophagus irregularis TaxID=588596 RepID=A0A2N0RXE1_9GLOM|nr:hypothetical protein RhiirA1_393268 [Rhizophagus irregularis]
MKEYDEDNQQSTNTSTKRGRKKKETATSRKKNKEAVVSSPLYDNHQLIDDLLNDTEVSNHELNGVANEELSQSPISYSNASSPDNLHNTYQDVSLTPLTTPLSPLPDPESRSSSPTDFFHSHGAVSRLLEVTPSKSSSAPESRSIFKGFPNTFDPNNAIVPSPFNEMTIYQLCSWLCANPNILQLANSMHLSTQVSVANGGRIALSPIFPNFSNITQNQEDKATVHRDYLDELKCLFLRVRHPPKNAIQELVRQIFKCDLNSAEGIECLKVANKNLGDSRNKLINSIMELVKSFNEQRSRNTTEPLQKDEITKFVDESVTIHVLSRWLNATNIDELKAQHSLPHLRRFVQHAFVINYKERNIEGTKALDNLTKSITVPSQSGKNFASNL